MLYEAETHQQSKTTWSEGKGLLDGGICGDRERKT